MPKSNWHVYLLRCADKSLYCGIASDLTRRVAEHNGSQKAARYTRSRRPVTLVWSEQRRSRSAALKREFQIKSLKRKEKEKLFA
jgi:putative endonuclease